MQQLTDYLAEAGQRLTNYLGQARYQLQIDDCAEHLSVFSHYAEEALSTPWHYIITVTCPNADIDTAAILLKSATFTFLPAANPLAPPLRQVMGVIDDFRRLSSSVDETRYRLRLVPRLALLQHTLRSNIHLNQSVPQVVEQLLREHQLTGEDFEFRFTRSYPQRELITQWKETDLAFIQRILAEVGIFYRFTMSTLLNKEVLIFADDLQHYVAGPVLPLRNPAGMEDSGQASIWGVTCTRQVISARVTTQDYNYREALTPQQSSSSARADAQAVWGEVYRYGEPFLSAGAQAEAESGAFYALLTHQRLLSGQYQVQGHASCAEITPGQIVRSQDKLPHTVAEGIFITAVRQRGARDRGLVLTFDGIPYSEQFCWRPAAVARPFIAGTLPARIESTQRSDTYSWLDKQGRYRVKVDYDRNERERAYAYLWLRLARPYAGDGYGWHAPLLDGTEVGIAFDGGDPDRPYIAGAHHDSAHSNPVTSDNHTRNVLRTPANNKLRMEDKREREHIKLATEYGKTQLNLGHLTDSRRQQRGSGFELRTDEYGALRAAGGLLLMADGQPRGVGAVLARGPTLNRVAQAHQQLTGLNQAARQAGALEADLHAQLDTMKERVEQLQAALIVASAPDGVLFASRKEIEMSSQHSTIISAGRDVDIGAQGKMALKAEKSLGLFAQRGPMRLIANQGKVNIEAQNNGLAVTARQQLTISSTEEEITIVTPKTLTLNGGGSYLKLSAEGIEHGSEGNFIVKAGQYQVTGKGASLKMDLPTFTGSDAAQKTASTVDKEVSE